MVRVKFYPNKDSIEARVTYNKTVKRKVFKDKADAKKWAAQLAAEFEKLAAQEVLGLTTRPVVGAIEKKKISEAVKHHVEQRKLKTDLENLSTDRSYFKRFYEFMFHRGKDFIHEVTLADLESLQLTMVNEGQQNSSINRFFASINGFLNRCVDWKYLHENPGAKLKSLPVINKKRKTWTQEEAESVLKQLQPWAQDYFRFLYATGCRPKEASNLTFGDIDQVNQTVKLRTMKGGAPRERTIPVSESIITLVHEIRRSARVRSLKIDQEYVFKNSYGHRVHPEVFSNEVKEARRRLGLDDKLTPYGLRHTYCTTLADSNIALAKIQAMAGHSRAQTTMGYINLSDESLRNVVALVEEKRRPRAK